MILDVVRHFNHCRGLECCRIAEGFYREVKVSWPTRRGCRLDGTADLGSKVWGSKKSRAKNPSRSRSRPTQRGTWWVDEGRARPVEAAFTYDIAVR